MTNLLDDLRNAPTPLSLQSRGPLIAAVKKAQLSLLRVAIQRSQGDDADSRDVAQSLRRYALWLEHAVFVGGIDDESVLEVSAALYEFVAGLTNTPPTSIFRPPLNDLLRSAIAASLTPFQGRAAIVASRVADSLDGQDANSSVERCHLQAAAVVASLLARRFHEAFVRNRALAAWTDQAVAELSKIDAAQREYYALDSAVGIAHASADAASGMLAGVPLLVETALTEFESLRNAASERDDSGHFWLADRLHATVSRMYQTSMHRLLGYAGTSIPHRYRHLLARDGFLEMWGPQLDALQKGIADPNNGKHYVISVPTGAGKTMLAELLILSSLSNQDGWAIYIAPSRSLVSQASQDLRRRLQPCGVDVQTILAGAEQSYMLSEELELIRRKRSVVVTTPEKLDMYYRNARELFDTCRLLVIDEAHKVGDETRGPMLESLVARFLVLQPGVRVALMSGVIGNPEEFRSWLGDDYTESIVARRRPTRQTFGVAVRQSPPNELRPPRDKINKTTNERKTIRRVDFSGGIAIVNEDDDVAQGMRVDLPDVFTGHYWQYLRGTAWLEDRRESRSPTTNHAVAIAQALAPAPGTLLVFVSNPRWAESCSRNFSYIENRFVQQRQQLAEFLALELGTDHELPALCRRGVAFHHGRMPSSVQRAIELALERGWLKVVFATPTLREGINTPATTVIVAGLSYWNGTANAPMSVSDFSNLAGRAGRPRTETEGRIILVPNSLTEANAIEASREYILSGDAARRIRTQLRRLKDGLELARGELRQLPADQQRVLLSLKAAMLSDRAGLSAFLDSTLWSCQEQDANTISRVIDLASDTFMTAEESIGERLELVSRLGLSLTAAESLREAILATPMTFRSDDGAAVERRIAQISALLAVSLTLEEIGGEITRSDIGVESHLAPLLEWIDGAEYAAILEAGRESKLFKRSSKVSDAVKYASDASTWLSWSFGVAWSIIEAEFEDPDPQVGILPLLIRYGVPTASAAFVSLLGVADRTAAQVLGVAFEQTGLPASLHSVSNWMQSIDVDEMFPPERHQLRAELLRRQAFRAFRPALPYEFAAFVSNQRVGVGEFLRLRRNGRQVLVGVQDRIVGEVVEEDLADIQRLLEGSAGSPYVITVAAASPNQQGALLAIR